MPERGWWAGQPILETEIAREIFSRAVCGSA